MSEKLTDLQKKILAYLVAAGEPTLTLVIAKGCGMTTTKEVNPAIYGLEKKGLVVKTQQIPPMWDAVPKKEETWDAIEEKPAFVESTRRDIIKQLEQGIDPSIGRNWEQFKELRKMDPIRAAAEVMDTFEIEQGHERGVCPELDVKIDQILIEKQKQEKQQKTENENTKKEETQTEFEQKEAMKERIAVETDSEDEMPELEQSPVDRGLEEANRKAMSEQNIRNLAEVGQRQILKVPDSINPSNQNENPEWFTMPNWSNGMQKIYNKNQQLFATMLTHNETAKLEKLMDTFSITDNGNQVPNYHFDELANYLIDYGHDTFNEVLFFDQSNARFEFFYNQRLFSRKLLSSLFWNRSELKFSADNYGVMNGMQWFLESGDREEFGRKITSLLGDVYHDLFQIFTISDPRGQDVESENSFLFVDNDVPFSNNRDVEFFKAKKDNLLTRFILECALNNIFHVAVLKKEGLEMDIAIGSHEAIRTGRTTGVITVLPNMIKSLKTGIYWVSESVATWDIIHPNDMVRAPILELSNCEVQNVLILSDDGKYHNHELYLNEIFSEKHCLKFAPSDLVAWKEWQIIQFKLFDKNTISCCAIRNKFESCWSLHIWRDSGVVNLDNASRLSGFAEGQRIRIDLLGEKNSKIFTFEKHLPPSAVREQLYNMVSHPTLKNAISSKDIVTVQSRREKYLDKIKLEPTNLPLFQRWEPDFRPDYDLKTLRRMYIEAPINTRSRVICCHGDKMSQNFVTLTEFKDFALTNKGAHSYNGNQSNDNFEFLSEINRQTEEEIMEIPLKTDETGEIFTFDGEVEPTMKNLVPFVEGRYQLPELFSSKSSPYHAAKKWSEKYNQLLHEFHKKCDKLLVSLDNELVENWATFVNVPDEELSKLGSSEFNKAVMMKCLSQKYTEEMKNAVYDTEIDPMADVVKQFPDNTQFGQHTSVGRAIVLALKKTLKYFAFRPDCLQYSDKIIMMFTEACIISTNDTFDVCARQMAIMGDAYLTSHIARRFLLFGEKNLTQYQNKRSKISSNKNLATICDKLIKFSNTTLPLPITQGNTNEAHKATMVEALIFLTRVFCTNVTYSTFVRFIEDENG